MQCPSCDHIAPTADFGDPLRCPDCGAFYEKALELKLRKAAPAAPVAEPPPRAPVKGLVPCRSCKAPISKNAGACPHCGAIPKKKTSLFTWIVAGFMALWFLGYIAGEPSSRSGSAPSADSSGPAPSVSPLQAAMAATELRDFSWSKTAGGSLMKADFTIRNNGATAIKDIEITCDHQGPSGTKIDSNTRTIFEIVPAGKTRTFKSFDMGFIHSQAVSTSCRIKKISI